MDDYLDMSNKSSFDFSFEDDIDSDTTYQLENLKQEIERLQNENEKQRKLNREVVRKITKLLINLKTNPDKPLIKWPNRVVEIDSFLKELNKMVEQ